jgi:hypothetical protein
MIHHSHVCLRSLTIGLVSLVIFSGCGGSGSSEDPGSPGTSGSAGQSGAGQAGSQASGSSGAGTSGAGNSGSAGSAGSVAGSAGTGGVAGTAGAGGAAGMGGTAGAAGTGGCSTSAECGTGVCLQSGVCCPSVEQSCDGVCCGSGDVCLFDMCITPGKDCQSSADCNPDEYCEVALGENGGGMGGAGGMGTGGMGGGAGMGTGGQQICTQPIPANGKCLPLPKTCTGAPTDPPDCLEPCVYKPKDAKLKAEAAWSWGKATVKEFPDSLDVWSTPTVARINDANCDGKVDELDPPNMVFVSGNTGAKNCNSGQNPAGTCKMGVLRMLDGRNGQEVWSLAKASPNSIGFAAGLSTALGDVDGNGTIEIFAVTGEGAIVVVVGKGKVIAQSTDTITGASGNSFGWGGALAIADMNHDGNVEIAYGANVFTVDMQAKTITKLFDGGTTFSGDISRPISTFVDLENDMEGNLELLVGSALYRYDGTTVWAKTALNSGYAAVADLDGDSIPEVAFVRSSQLWVLEGDTGNIKLGPVSLPGTKEGGPPTIADFDGKEETLANGMKAKLPEIGIALDANYAVVKPNFTTNQLELLWSTPNHDLSSSVTGSSVFDFEGDGKAEVVYNDECFLWVYDGPTGHVKFATPTLSFTATESSIVADVDGDGHAEMVMVANGVDPGNPGWKCDVSPWNEPITDPDYGRPAWAPPPGDTVYRGITVWRDKANSWVGTRTIWNEHSYHVSNICDDRDTACSSENTYGRIPLVETKNWTVPWLNNFRQNVQDGGIYNAADAVVDISISCRLPYDFSVSVKNQGLAILPAGVKVEVVQIGPPNKVVQTGVTDKALYPGQTQTLVLPGMNTAIDEADKFLARIVVDPLNPTFHECIDTNNKSKQKSPECAKP